MIRDGRAPPTAAVNALQAESPRRGCPSQGRSWRGTPPPLPRPPPHHRARGPRPPVPALRPGEVHGGRVAPSRWIGVGLVFAVRAYPPTRSLPVAGPGKTAAALPRRATSLQDRAIRVPTIADARPVDDEELAQM